MTQKVYNLIVGVLGGVSAIAVAVVSFTEPAYMEAINASIVIVQTAIVEVCSKFIKEPDNKA